MPRGDNRVWKHYGSSYAELSARDVKASAPSSSPAPSPTDIRSLPAAGAPSSLRPRGAGSFVYQADWGMAPRPAPASGTLPAPKATEARTQFQPPPDDYKRRAPLRTDKSNFPQPNYPHEFKTTTQQDFGTNPSQQAGYERAHAARHKDSGRLLPVDDVPPQYTTQAVADFEPRGRPGDSVAARTGPRAGNPATQNPGYNIITGGGHAVGNNVFERWDGRDYRRHR